MQGSTVLRFFSVVASTKGDWQKGNLKRKCADAEEEVARYEELRGRGNGTT